MQNNTHSPTKNLGIFGWNFSFIGGIKLATDEVGYKSARRFTVTNTNSTTTELSLNEQNLVLI